MENHISIVKVGGAFLEDASLLETLCRAFAGMEGLRILVHGGGQRASRLGRELGIVPRMVDGRRITDAQTLDLVTMVYAGWANKTLVARLQALKCNALGVSGADANLIRAERRPPEPVDFGYVGDVAAVDLQGLQQLLGSGLVPVFCALTHDEKGQLLNTNADTIAASLAIALSGVYHTNLYYCFEKQGVLRDTGDPESVIPQIDPALFERLRNENAIAEGMIPKLFNGFEALKAGVGEVRIGQLSLLTGQALKFTQLQL